MADSPAASDNTSPSPTSTTPLQRLAARMRQQNAQSGNGAESVPGSPTADPQSPDSHNLNINADNHDGASPSDLSSPAGNHTRSATFAHLGPSLKRARKLGQQAGMDLDIFLAASSLEREGQQYALVLSCHDKLNALVGHLDYKVPATLSDTCKDYAYGFLLSPTITAYRYVKTLTAILAMRELNVADVPPKRETGRCTQVERVIRGHLTTYRHTIKDKIVNTLKSSTCDPVNIASLTASIVSTTKVKPTAALYMRIPFIQWVAQEWPEIQGKDSDEDFWLKIDEQLREQVAEFKTPSKIQEVCQTIYDADKSQFGPPDLINHPVTATYLQDDWLIALSDKSNTLPQNSQSKKRARADDI